jgi:hypothetical protein
LVSGIGFGVGVAALAGAVVVHFAQIGRGSRSPSVAAGPGRLLLGGSF